jgi:integrase
MSLGVPALPIRASSASLRSVEKGLPRQPVDENHFPAMRYADIPAFVKLLSRLTPSTGRDALLFTIFAAARSGETRMATWSEFDRTAKTWTVPSSRMKMKRTPIVPLSAPVIEILRRRLKLRSENDLVFSKTGITPSAT